MPTLDLTAYSGRDDYTDGPVEDDLLNLVRSGEDYETILARDTRWPILYHLTPQRRNLLEWYPFQSAASLLEIGAGCGALTGLFLDKLKHVTAVELSRKRAAIIEARYPSADHLHIRVGNVLAMNGEPCFDYVTLIGVLEYAGLFVADPAPALSLLKRAREWLKPGGVLFLAIENKFGLKYFSGAGEDHSGQAFQGIEGYVGDCRAITYAREELNSLVRAAGFRVADFYYPHPDYKLPTELFSDLRLPDESQALAAAPNYDFERVRLFDETLAMTNVIRAGLFPTFANSFLVLAGG